MLEPLGPVQGFLSSNLLFTAIKNTLC